MVALVYLAPCDGVSSFSIDGRASSGLRHLDCLLLTSCGLIRSVLSYAYPAWCNVGSGDMGALTRFERRICKRFRVECKVSFDCFCASAAKNLAQKALASHHPLNGIFDTAATRTSSRVGKGYSKVLARTSRFKKSFISFA